jgi:hypothetical protein
MGALLQTWAIAHIDLILWACGGLVVSFFALLGFIGRDIYKKVHGKGLVTTDHCQQCEAAQKKAHDIVDARLAAGDGVFKEIHQGQRRLERGYRVLALFMYEMCKQFNTHFNMDFNCEALQEIITGDPDHV